MKTSIKLGFIGSYKTDLLHYMAHIFKGLKKEVTVCDVSKEQHLYYSLPDMEGEGSIFYQGIDYRCLIDQESSPVKMNFEGSDVVMIDFGLDADRPEDIRYCDLIFIVTDFKRDHVLKLKKMMKGYISNSENIVIIFREVLSSKINPVYIRHLLELEGMENILAEYVFDYRQEDEICKLFGEYDHLYRFKKLSKDYKVFFADILEELYEIEHSQGMKLIKSVEGGLSCR